MVRVKLIGAGGYGGIGLVELLHRHPEAKFVALVDVQGVGERLSDMWPYLEGYCDATIVAPDSDRARDVEADVAVFATPDGIAQDGAAAEVAAGRKVIDYSGDFRFNSTELYSEYARRIEQSAVGWSLQRKRRVADLFYPAARIPGGLAAFLGSAPVSTPPPADTARAGKIAP